MQFEVTWATGDTEVMDAEDGEAAYDLARELLPKGGSWVDINIVAKPEEDLTFEEWVTRSE